MFWDWWAGGGGLGWAGLARGLGWGAGWVWGRAGQGRAGQNKVCRRVGQGRAAQRQGSLGRCKIDSKLGGRERGGGAATKLAACKSCSYQYRHRDAEVG